MRVLSTRVIAPDKHDAIRKPVGRAVGEPWPTAHHQALTFEQPKVGVEANLSKRNDDANPAKGVDLPLEMGKALLNLFRSRLVVGWRAAYGRRDERVFQCEAVGWMIRG